MPALIGHSQGISGGRSGQTISGAWLMAAHNGIVLKTVVQKNTVRIHMIHFLF